MKIQSSKSFLIGCFALALVACNQAQPPADAPGAATQPQTDAKQTAAKPMQTTPEQVAQPTASATEFGEKLLWLDTLAECHKEKQIGTIHWSSDAIAGGPAAIELGDAAGQAVFARVGAEGSKQTGDWASPGQAIVLRGEDGAVRARQVFKGPGGCVN